MAQLVTELPVETSPAEPTPAEERIPVTEPQSKTPRPKTPRSKTPPPKKAQVKRSSQGPLTIWHGMDVPRLVKHLSLKPKLSVGKALHIATLPGMALYNSAARAAEAVAYGGRIKRADLPETPLFLMGHWRSGTTLLHNLICQDPQWSFPNLYQCVFPHHFLLTEKVATKLTGWMMPSTRPMDNVPTGWDLPQEDEIALCVLSLCSPYRMLADMRLPVYERFFDAEHMTPEDRQQWEQTVLYLMRKLHVRDPRPLCMKSPSHTARVAAFLKLFPKAKFLTIHRNPYKVYQSTNHLRHTMWGENGLSNAEPTDIEEQTLACYETTMKAYERDKPLIPAGQLHEIHLEELEQDIVGTLERSYDALGLSGFDALKARIEPQVPALQKYKKNTFVMDDAERKRVYERLRFAFEAYGYEA